MAGELGVERAPPSGLDFTRVPRGGGVQEARWAEPWIVVWASPGYSARTGLWRLLVGLRERAVEGARERHGKRGYPLANLEAGVYVARSSHADRTGQFQYRLLIEAGQITELTAEQVVLETMRFGD